MNGESEARRDEPPGAFEDVRPEAEPFPLSDAVCARLVRNHPVRWRGTLAPALRRPGRYELVAGRLLYLRRD